MSDAQRLCDLLGLTPAEEVCGAMEFLESHGREDGSTLYLPIRYDGLDELGRFMF